MSEHIVGKRIPDLRQVIVDLVLRYRMRRGGGRPISVEGMRRNAARFEDANARLKMPPFVDIEPVQVGSIPGEWINIKDAQPGGVVLYFHGGGFVMGSPRTHRIVTWRIARATGRRVLAIEYRKAPDHAFPAWVDDGAAAFQWLLDHGYAAKDILFAGDSAGGNLALSVVHRLRREGRPLPGGLILFSPWADLGCEADSYHRNRHSDAMFHASSVRETGAFLTRGAEPRHPEHSPVHADLAGYPPMLLFAGSRELFLDDAREIRRRAAASGVRAELHIYRNMPHVFPMLAAVLPRAKPAFDTIKRFVAETASS